MEKSEAEALIAKTVKETLRQLRDAGLLPRMARGSIRRTEELLRVYPKIRLSEDKTATRRTVERVDMALDEIRNDPYFRIIPAFYFDGITRDMIAMELGVSVGTISRNKARLLEELAPLLFSESVVGELYSTK